MENLEALIQFESPPQVLYAYETIQGFMRIIQGRALPVPDIRFVNENIEIAYLAELVARESARILEARSAAALAAPPLESPEPAGRPARLEPTQDELCFELLLDEIAERLTAPPRYHLFARHLAQEGDHWAGRGTQDFHSKSLSLGFDSRLLSQHAEPLGFKLHKCIFNEAKQQKIIQDLLAEAQRRLSAHSLESPDFRLHLNNIADDFLGLCIQLSALFKHPAHYQGEHWSLFCMPPLIEPTDTHLQFHELNGRLTPWLAIDLPGRPDQPFPLTRLIMAPTPQPELAVDAVELLLLSSGITTCRVEGSRVPYQQF